jgi:NADPH:quinone reductase
MSVGLRPGSHAARAVVLRQVGGAEELHVEPVDIPVPAQHDVLIEVKAAGVNFMDIYHRRGDYETSLPAVPGIEGAGTVMAVGELVSDLAVGDRVAFMRTILDPGAYTEVALAPRHQVVRLPDEVAFEIAAALLVQGVSAHYLANDAYAIQSGDIVLIHAAAGGLGLLLVQLAKQAGATVLGTVSTEAKADTARRFGTDAVINYSYEDVAARVRHLTDGVGVNAVYDGVGAATFDASLDALRPRGTLAVYGTPSGDLPLLDTWRIWEKSLKFTRTQLKHHSEPDELIQRTTSLFQAVMAGTLEVSIDSVHPLESAGVAQNLLEERRNVGKVLLVP